MTSLKALPVKIPTDLYNRLSDLSTKTHRTKTSFVREALSRYIEDLEDYYLAVSVSAQNNPTYTPDEVRKMCGLED